MTLKEQIPDLSELERIARRMARKSWTDDDSQAFDDAFNPETVLRLIALAREGEGLSRDLSHTVTAVTSIRSHTPGPWEIVPSRVSKNHCIYSREGYGIGEAWDLQGNPENAANARLIAAAPDLLEALKLVTLSTEWSCMEADTQAAALAAIAKATPSSASPAVCEESRDEQSNGSLALQEGIGN